MQNMKRVQIYIPTPMLLELDKLTREKGITRSELIRAAIEFYLKKGLK